MGLHQFSTFLVLFLCFCHYLPLSLWSFSSDFPFHFHAIHKCMEILKPTIYTASGLDSVSPLSRNGFAFGLRLQAWICLLLIVASASLVITRHFISDFQLDAFLNRDPEIRLWMTVTQQCPSSSVSKPLSLPLNDSNLPIKPFSIWRGTFCTRPSWTPSPY